MTEKELENKREYNRRYRERNREALKLYARKYRAEKGSPRDKEKQKATLAAWVKKYPERRRAHHKVRYALAAGKLKRTPCVVCGVTTVQAHHEDYSKPLDVIWLCPIHHHEYDAKIGKRKGT